MRDIHITYIRFREKHIPAIGTVKKDQIDCTSVLYGIRPVWISWRKNLIIWHTKKHRSVYMSLYLCNVSVWMIANNV